MVCMCMNYQFMYYAPPCYSMILWYALIMLCTTVYSYLLFVYFFFKLQFWILFLIRILDISDQLIERIIEFLSVITEHLDNHGIEGGCSCIYSLIISLSCILFHVLNEVFLCCVLSLSLSWIFPAFTFFASSVFTINLTINFNPQYHC